MFIKEIDDKSKIWTFTMRNGHRLVGPVTDYALDTLGHPIMVQIQRGLTDTSLVDLPWSSVLYVNRFP